MADRKISDLTALTTPASGDYLPIVDISEAAAASKNKRITIEELFRGVPLGTAAAPSIAIEGDEDTGVFSPGANQLAVATNGTGRLLVDASGNVGVGVAPSVRLQVQNSIAGGSGGTIATLHNFSDAGGDTRYTGLNFVIGSDNGTSAIRAGRTNSSTNYETNLSFWTNPTGATQTPVQRMTLDSTGRLGVGTSIPGSFNSAANQLVVGNGSADQGLTVYTGTANQGSIFFADGTTGGAQQAAGYIIYPHSGDYMAFGTANTERLRITSAGLVGIGSSSPASKLTVAGTQGNFRVDPDSVSNEVQLFATVPDNSGFINYRIRAYQLFVDTSGVTALTIDSSQRVGIGSSSPGYALDVVGTVNSNALFRASNGTHIALLGSEAFSAGVVGVGSGSNHPLVLGTNSAERARIDTSGRLLVGTSSDSGGALFQVNGDRIRVGTAKTPATSGATGTTGEIAWDADYIYVCTATNTWKRSAIATW